ncbi:MAG: DUF2279 domain-containing protein [Candidatus Kapabacteria bacterium]|nr:DUF2279 domain-containing protein [Candidatus Kapabacteria bacterium]
MKNSILILIFLFSFNTLIAIDTTKINPYKLGGLLGVSTGAFIYGQIDQKEKYWGNVSDFSVMPWHQEYDDALMADKFGHLFFGYTVSKLYQSAFQWCGLDSNQSAWYAGGLAFSFHTYVEINDGYSTGKPYLGFSRGDWIADAIGAGFPIVQRYYPEFKNISFKISFNKSSNFEKNGYTNLSDDSESTYNWISFNVYDMLNSDFNKYYPSFVNLALGHNVKNLNRYGSGNHEIYLALDWNFEKLPIEGELGDFLKKVMNSYRFPSPAVKIYPNVVWYGLKF